MCLRWLLSGSAPAHLCKMGLFGQKACAFCLRRLLGKFAPRFRWLPLAGGWTRHRDFPAPEVQTFQAQWKRRVKTQ